MEMNEIKKDFLNDILKYEMSDTIQCRMANEYINIHNGRTIFMNDDDGLEDMLCATDKSEIVRAICFGNYRFNDKFVRINDHCNIESLDDVWDCVSMENMIDWLINGDEDDLADAYMILKEDDIADVLNYFVECFADNLDYEHEDVSNWVYEEDINVIQLCREDWDNLHEEFKMWKERKDIEWDKTLERCGLI